MLCSWIKHGSQLHVIECSKFQQQIYKSGTCEEYMISHFEANEVIMFDYAL